MIPVGCGTKECLPFRLTRQIVASRIPYKISDLQTKHPNLIQRGKEKGQSFLPNVSEHRGEGYDDGRENVVGYFDCTVGSEAVNKLYLESGGGASD